MAVGSLAMVLPLFWCMFVVTLAALGAALWSGLTARRRWHLWLGPLGLLSLAVTILLAERLARQRDFPPDVLRIHLFFAQAGALLALPVVVTGLALARNPRWRRWHRSAVIVFALVAVAATGTGIWMFSLSTPK